MEILKSIGNYKYRYLKLGTGHKKLLVLWGFASFKENATKLVDQNFSNYTTLIPEYPYHNNFDDSGMEDISIEALSDYLKDLLRHEDFTDFDVLGFSLGGLMALEIAKNCRGFRIGKAIIWASPVLGFKGVTDLPSQLASIYTRSPKDRLQAVHINKLFQKALLTRGIKVFDPDQVKKYLIAFQSYRLATLEENLNYLFIYDPLDALVSIKNAQYIKKLVDHGNVELVEMRGGGHFGTKTGWEKALAKIKDFLDK